MVNLQESKDAIILKEVSIVLMDPIENIDLGSSETIHHLFSKCQLIFLNLVTLSFPLNLLKA